jgi:hypothetical protein
MPKAPYSAWEGPIGKGQSVMATALLPVASSRSWPGCLYVRVLALAIALAQWRPGGKLSVGAADQVEFSG